MIEVLTMVLVAITGFYAWATYEILQANKNVVREMQRQSEEMARPRISILVHTLPSRPIFHLAIRNIGPSAAENLWLRLSKPFSMVGEDRELSTMPAFSRSVPNFGPGEAIEFQLGLTHEILGDNRDEALRPLQFAVEAEYWFGSKHYIETTHIDLNMQQMTSLTTDAIVEQMDYINRHLHEIRQALRAMMRT